MSKYAGWPTNWSTRKTWRQTCQSCCKDGDPMHHLWIDLWQLTLYASFVGLGILLVASCLATKWAEQAVHDEQYQPVK